MKPGMERWLSPGEHCAWQEAAESAAGPPSTIPSAGGVKNAASQMITALKAKGNMSAKAKVAFKDLGSSVVAAAVEVLGINTIITNCTYK
jgi:hypothetical protein